MYMTEVGVPRRWITAQAISVEAERQKQSWAAECIQPDAVGPTDVQGGGGEVIEMSHSLDKKTPNWSLKFNVDGVYVFSPSPFILGIGGIHTF